MHLQIIRNYLYIIKLMEQSMHYRSLDGAQFLPSLKFREMNYQNPYINFPQRIHEIPKVNRKVNSNTKSVASLASVQQSDFQVGKPFFVSERQEWNQQKFVFRRKRKRREHVKGEKRIDNELEAQFPVHKEFDYVQMHSLGFKGKQNIDLFKFYYRLYMKNKFFIQKLRKQKKERLRQKEEMEQQASAELHKKSHMIRQSVLMQKGVESILKSKQTESSEELEKNGLIKSLAIKQFIIQNGLDEIKGYERLLLPVETVAVDSPLLKLPKLHHEQSKPKLKVISIEVPQMHDDGDPQQALEMQQIFISRIIEKIQKVGIHQIDKQCIAKLIGITYYQNQEIINSRKSQLTDMQRSIELEQLLKLKQKIYKSELEVQKHSQELMDRLFIEQQSDNFNESMPFPDESTIKPSGQQSILEGQTTTGRQPFSIYDYKFNDYDHPSVIKHRKQTKGVRYIKQNGPHQQQQQLWNQEQILSIQGLIPITRVDGQPETEVIISNISQPESTTKQALKSQASARLADHYYVAKDGNGNEQRQSQNIAGKHHTDSMSDPNKSQKSHKESIISNIYKKDSQVFNAEEQDIEFERMENPLDVKMKELLERLASKHGDYTYYAPKVHDHQGQDPLPTEMDNTQLNQIGQDLISLLVLQTSGAEFHNTFRSDNLSLVLSEHPNDDNRMLDTNMSQQENQSLADHHHTFTIGSAKQVQQEKHLTGEQIESIKEQIKLRLEAAHLPPEIITKQLHIFENQLSLYLGKPPNDTTQTNNQTERRQTFQEIPPDLVVIQEEEVGLLQAIPSHTARRTLQDKSEQSVDYANFYEENAQSLQEGRLIQEMRDLQAQQDQQLKRVKIQAKQALDKQRSTSPNIGQLNSNSDRMQQRHKGKKKQDEFGNNLEEKAQLMSYKLKESQADKTKHVEHLKKIQEMNADQKKMFIQAEHVKYAKHQEDADEELEYLQSVMDSHKNQKDQLFSEFKQELSTNKKKKNAKNKLALESNDNSRPQSMLSEDIQKLDQEDPRFIRYMKRKQQKKEKIARSRMTSSKVTSEEDGVLKPFSTKLKPIYKPKLQQSSKEKTQVIDKSKPVNKKTISQVQKTAEQFNSTPDTQQFETNNAIHLNVNQINSDKLQDRNQTDKSIPDNIEIDIKRESKTKQKQKVQRSRNGQKGKRRTEEALSGEQSARQEDEDYQDEDDDGEYDDYDEELEDEDYDDDEDQEDPGTQREDTFTESKGDVGSSNYQQISHRTQQTQELEPGTTSMKMVTEQNSSSQHKDQATKQGSNLASLPLVKTVSKIIKAKKITKAIASIIGEAHEQETDLKETNELANNSKKARQQKQQMMQNVGDLMDSHQVPGEERKRIRESLISFGSDSNPTSQVNLLANANTQKSKKKSPQRGRKQARGEVRESVESVDQGELSREISVQDEDEENPTKNQRVPRKAPAKQNQSRNRQGTVRNNAKNSKNALKQGTQQLVEQKPPTPPKKKYNLKEELDIISRRNLSLKELKELIENKIKEVADPDDETKYNVYLYQQRQRQLKNFQTQLHEIMNDAHERVPECSDVVKTFYDARAKYKEVTGKDKTLKFSNQLKIMDEDQKNDGVSYNDLMDDVQANIQRMLILAQQNILRETAEDRRAIFLHDSEQLKLLRKITAIQQMNVETKTAKELAELELERRQQQVPFRSSIIDPNDANRNRCSEVGQTDKLNRLRTKLREIKKSQPDRFKDMLNESISIKNLEQKEGAYLEIKYKKLI